MAFTDQEKARIKHHLGYPDWVALSGSIQLGYPAGAHPLFLVEDAFKRLTAGGEEAVRIDLCNCDDIERQLGEARGRMRAAQIGNLMVNKDEPAMLRSELAYWKKKLADDLGVPPNPYSQSEHATPGGVNARVE